MEYIDLKVYISKLLKNWLIISLCAIIGMASMFIYSEFFTTPVYSSSVKIGVFNSDWSTNVSANDIETASRLMENCLVVLKDEVMAEKISATLKERTGKDYSASYVRSVLSYSQIDDSQWIQVYARTTDPELSALICNAVSANAPEIIVDSVANVQMKTLGSAKVNYNPISPNTTKNVLVGFLIGFVGSCLLICLFVFFDNTLGDENLIKEKYNLSILGVIPDVSVDAKKQKSKKNSKARII